MLPVPRAPPLRVVRIALFHWVMWPEKMPHIALRDRLRPLLPPAGVAAGRAHILVDVDPWMRSGEAVPALPTVHDGLIRGRRLDLDYRDSETRARS